MHLKDACCCPTRFQQYDQRLSFGKKDAPRSLTLLSTKVMIFSDLSDMLGKFSTILTLPLSITSGLLEHLLKTLGSVAAVALRLLSFLFTLNE